MQDATSDLGEDIDPAEAPECATCGERIMQAPKHRVETWVDPDGQVQHRHFCDPHCQARFHRD
ncbi:MAG: hypothetical protein RI544_01220 [Haloquadratum sp.]|jgi:hypothetical protein|nr:hypothetical protein [Haloferacaceae archaeon]MDR9444761.1 hypothetical protein [Haloquadratum sp.]